MPLSRTAHRGAPWSPLPQLGQRKSLRTTKAYARPWHRSCPGLAPTHAHGTRPGLSSPSPPPLNPSAFQLLASKPEPQSIILSLPH